MYPSSRNRATAAARSPSGTPALSRAASISFSVRAFRARSLKALSNAVTAKSLPRRRGGRGGSWKKKPPRAPRLRGDLLVVPQKRSIWNSSSAGGVAAGAGLVAAGFAPAGVVARAGAPGRAGGGGREGALPFWPGSSVLSQSSQVDVPGPPVTP